MIRRQFCKTLSCAALGTISAISFGGPGFGKEVSMKKKVKAVTVKVINVKGTCGLHKVGDVATISESGVEGKICIHALYSMMSGAFAMLYDVEFPWLENPEKKTHACPDAANPVVFEIAKVREA